MDRRLLSIRFSDCLHIRVLHHGSDGIHTAGCHSLMRSPDRLRSAQSDVSYDGLSLPALHGISHTARRQCLILMQRIRPGIDARLLFYKTLRLFSSSLQYKKRRHFCQALQAEMLFRV